MSLPEPAEHDLGVPAHAATPLRGGGRSAVTTASRPVETEEPTAVVSAMKLSEITERAVLS